MIRDRGISSVIATILMIVLVVALAAVVLSIFMGVAILPAKPPLAATIEGRALLMHETGMGSTSQIVEIFHRAGDPIPVKDISIMVAAWRNGTMMKCETCTGFPSTSFAGKCTGDNIIDKSNLGKKVLGELHSSSNGLWTPGEQIGLRLKLASGGTGVNLKSGDVVETKIIYLPSQLVIIDQEYPVTVT
jgi:flagellin-like protein